jgi:hypothetical protein
VDGQCPATAATTFSSPPRLVFTHDPRRSACGIDVVTQTFHNAAVVAAHCWRLVCGTNIRVSHGMKRLPLQIGPQITIIIIRNRGMLSAICSYTIVRATKGTKIGGQRAVLNNRQENGGVRAYRSPRPAIDEGPAVQSKRPCWSLLDRPAGFAHVWHKNSGNWVHESIHHRGARTLKMDRNAKVWICGEYLFRSLDHVVSVFLGPTDPS